MAYRNDLHGNRLLNISVASNLFAAISAGRVKGASRTPVEGGSSNEYFYLVPELAGASIERDVFNMPFLLNSNGLPWFEANSYLFSLVANKHVMTRPTDDVRRKAARLLDYKLFTEQHGFDWLNFEARRLTARPTYRYFKYLVEERCLGAAAVNQYTGDVYSFYEFVSKNWHDLPMERVDRIQTIRIHYSGARGFGSFEKIKRSQTKRLPPAKSLETGYLRDEGETLRPLRGEELTEFIGIIHSPSWSPIERLIMLFALMTGARKQSVLTLRVKHVDQMIASGPGRNGSYKLNAGPGTKIDTKNGKPQILHLPSRLVDALQVYTVSKQFAERREKFKLKYRLSYPELPELPDEDMYVFLSDQGNCYYMGKDDPRYPVVKSRPIGQVVDTLKRKVLKASSDRFPRDFYYHWLRATYALLLWEAISPLVDSSAMTTTDAISIIQTRLHHVHRETSENYLKLLRKINVKYAMQEEYEKLLIPGYVMLMEEVNI